ncbi:hypothetical protein BBK36DRAFT_1182618 [Trichoderma citrinoviride]|uniref:Zn(2)-C6 fungal-type domain-containing protein n=1 Tax=Trichoderma citrinoviride TaxID=58853 RepID=A0A2T4B132_9HYPO|nr:hypothetical protein BBK36DRAFT_1182618 [Trichoderma citrinoviride]PTB63033.1 hypothetical protein BBK36DRAFT_1182618 [Trichoderma citrinoviride]
MPISRQKSCVQCRKAKARCSLALPRCSRCMSRNLPCEYAGGAVPRMTPYMSSSVLQALNPTSINTPTTHTSSSDTPQQHAGHVRVLAARHGQEGAATAPGYAALDPLGMISSSPSAATASSSSAGQMAAPQHSTTTRPDWPPLQVELDPPGPTSHAPAGSLDTSAMGLTIEPCHSVFSFLHNINMNPPDSEPDLDTRLRNPVTGSGTQSDFLLHDKASRVLTKRRGLTASSVLATRTILGQVCSYPAMLVSGHALPPFIHSRCSLNDDGGSTRHDCAREGRHACLGRTLSVCASLVGMWMDRTPVSSSFVWETIYNEVARMHKEHEAFDSETMLESIQALTVYMLLQAQDAEALVKNDVKLLLITLGELGQKLHSTLAYNTFIDTIETPLCRPTWVLYESARRTLCLLYIIEMFLEINLRQSESRCCQSFAAAPLPCVRDLWEVPSTYDWSKRYAAFLRGRSVARILTLKDYKLAQHLSPEELLLDGSSSSSSSGSSGSIMKDVMRWCEGMDSFGTLVSLAATLVKYV